MEITCKSSWDLWVTLPIKNNITLLGVTPNGINIKVSKVLEVDILIATFRERKRGSKRK